MLSLTICSEIEKHSQIKMEELHYAASSGDITKFHNLLEEDPSLLNRVSFTCPNKPPLHIAIMQGHQSLVQEVLNHSPQLAEQLDSQQTSLLHIASAKGYLDIVKKLITIAPDMCLSRDLQGRNPLHLATIKGQVKVLAELVRTAPLAGREKVDQGQTVLHLCVKYRKLPALEMLVQSLGDIVDARDENGETVLHLAVKDNQIETTRYLVNSSGIDINATNLMGQTALDISERYLKNTTLTEILKPRVSLSNNNTQPEKWLTKKRDSLMVVAILIATMAFQAGVTPPGGVWQEDLTYDPQGNLVANPHRAGEAVMAYRRGRVFKSFLHANTIAFVSSLSTILLLISGLPFRRRIFMWSLMVIMWLTVTSIAVTYGIALTVVRPRKDKGTVADIMQIGIGTWSAVMGILLIGNTVRLIDRWLINRGVTMWRPKHFREISVVKNESIAHASDTSAVGLPF